MSDELKDNQQQLPLDQTNDQQQVVASSDQDETIEELKRQIAERDRKAEAALKTAESERLARIEAERRMASSTQEVEQYKTQAQTAEQRAVANAIDAANRESESAQREYEAAMNAADYTAAGKAQAKIAKAEAAKLHYESAKAVLDQQAAQQTVRMDNVQPQYVDPTEQFIASQNPRVQSWLRQHPDAVVSKSGRPDFSNAAWAAHHSALAQGIAEGSDDYFAHLTESIAPQQAEEHDAEPAARTQRRAPTAAPVSRDVPSNRQQQGTRIRLTPAQVEMARISGLTEAQYAENLRALQAEGKLGRTTH